LRWTDPYGLAWGDPLPQWLVDGAAGFGDTLSFGATNGIRNMAGIGSVNKCSSAYSNGEWAAIAHGLVTGRAALKAAGFRFERGNWKQGGKWVSENSRGLWHAHLGTGAGLTKHHLPYQISNWWKNFMSHAKNGNAWSDIFNTALAGYGGAVAATGATNKVSDNDCGCQQ
jgi:hypothetical protein